MLIGGWELSPALFAGGVYNSNVDQAPGSGVGSAGERFVPSFNARFDNGIHKTELYGAADVVNYGNSDVVDKTIVDAKAGVSQTYAPTQDLTFRFIGGYARAADVFGSSALANANFSPTTTPSAAVSPIVVSPQVNPNRYNEFSGTVSADKKLGATFVGVTASATNRIFDNNPLFPANLNGTIYTITGRGGFNLTPQIYAFVDPSVNWQRYEDSGRNSNGYRVTAGLGTLGPAIWQGEVYGGYQAEKTDAVGTYDSPVLGVRVFYSPTPMWFFRASVDETLGAATVSTIASSQAGSRVTSALLNVEYKGLPPDWTTVARFGFVHTSYVGIDRADNAWLAGASVIYQVWRNLGVLLDYQYKAVDSDAPLQSFNQHVVSIGVQYRY